MTELASVVLFSRRLESTIAFYRTVGVPLEDEDHGDGLLHAAGDIGGVHVAILDAERRSGDHAPGWREAGSTFVGFNVRSLEETAASLRALGATVLVDHEVREWGCRAVVSDPDGRPVELNQRDHCGPD